MAPPERPAAPSGLRTRLQILLAFCLPVLAVLLWLNARGFFRSP